VQKALDHPVTFIWGPPGTGKTATLGHVLANALLYGQKDLFASNTNRAVDVGCLSALRASELLGVADQRIVEKITRFREPAPDDPLLYPYAFEKRREEMTLKGQDRAARNQEMLDELDVLQAQAEKARRKGFEVPREVEFKMDQINERIERFGGRETVE